MLRILPNRNYMDLSFVRVGELQKFAASSFNLEGYHIAITPWRAISHENNPDADPDDIALIYKQDEKGQICGYIGALPARFDDTGGKKFAWISGWWVKPGAGSAISTELLMMFLKNYDFCLMFSELPSLHIAEKVKNVSGAMVKERSGLHIWIRSNIAGKYMARRGISPYMLKLFRYCGAYYLIHMMDNMVNSILYPLHLVTAMLAKDKNLVVKRIQYPSEEDFKFILDCAGKDVYVPKLKDLEWISKYPWLIKKDKDNAVIGSKYFFSSFSESNELFWLKYSLEGQTTGMVMLSVRDGVAKTQFVYIAPDYSGKVCRAVLAGMLRMFRIKDIISYNTEFVNILNNTRFPCLRRKEIKRYFGVSKNLIPITGEEFTMQDGSGDYIFT